MNHVGIVFEQRLDQTLHIGRVVLTVCVGTSLFASDVTSGSPNAEPAPKTFTLYSIVVQKHFVNNQDDRARGKGNNPFGNFAAPFVSPPSEELNNGPFVGDMALLTYDLYTSPKLETKVGTAAFVGFADGLEVMSSYIPGQELGDTYQKENQVLEDMARQVGFKPKANLVDYVTKYPGYRDSNGKYEGWAYIAGPTTADDAVGMLVWRYNKAGGAGYLGFDTGKGDGSGDPQVDALLKKAQGEQDTERRKATIFEVQRYLAQKQYNIPKPGESSYFTLAWPALRNFNTYKGDRRLDVYYEWLDDTQAPLKKA